MDRDDSDDVVVTFQRQRPRRGGASYGTTLLAHGPARSPFGLALEVDDGGDRWRLAFSDEVEAAKAAVLIVASIHAGEAVRHRERIVPILDHLIQTARTLRTVADQQLIHPREEG